MRFNTSWPGIRPSFVMAGLVPALHVLVCFKIVKENVDARRIGVRKHAVLRTPMAGHDGGQAPT
jgi:hypothetical protein